MSATPTLCRLPWDGGGLWFAALRLRPVPFHFHRRFWKCHTSCCILLKKFLNYPIPPSAKKKKKIVFFFFILYFVQANADSQLGRAVWFYVNVSNVTIWDGMNFISSKEVEDDMNFFSSYKLRMTWTLSPHISWGWQNLSPHESEDDVKKILLEIVKDDISSFFLELVEDDLFFSLRDHGIFSRTLWRLCFFSRFRGWHDIK